MLSNTTIYTCDQCGRTSESYMKGLPLRWIAAERNVPFKPIVHLCSWACFQQFFKTQLASVPASTQQAA